MADDAPNTADGSVKLKIVVVAVVIVAVAAFFVFDLGRYLNIEYLKLSHETAVAFVTTNPIVSSIGFFAFYVVVTAVSLPGAALMTLAAGAIFGFGWGLLLVSFASSAGATLAMLITRVLLQDWVQDRFAEQLSAVNRGLAADGGFYLFSIRMVPLFPFFIVNLVMGVTRVSAWQFYWVSQLGMLAGSCVFVFAGTQLARVESLGDVLSPGLIIAFSLLGLFPLIARKGLAWMKRARARTA